MASSRRAAPRAWPPSPTAPRASRGSTRSAGPGGLFVTIAKKQVFGDVGIDSIYGPTETVIIADESADPELVAADLIAQAEHDALASPILLTPSHYLADEVAAAIERQLADAGTREDRRAPPSTNRGGCILVNDIDHAIELANDYAPEHLCLCVENPSAYATKVRNCRRPLPRRGFAGGRSATTPPGRATRCPRAAALAGAAPSACTTS